jgi:hypothetical protein
MIEERVAQAGIAAVYGTGYGLYGVLTKKPEDEDIEPRKLARSVASFVGAAMVLQSTGQELSPDNLEAASSVSALGILGDMGVSKIQQE